MGSHYRKECTKFFKNLYWDDGQKPTSPAVEKTMEEVQNAEILGNFFVEIIVGD